MQMTLAEAQAEYKRLQAQLLRLEGYITALMELAAEERGAEQSASTPPAKLKAV